MERLTSRKSQKNSFVWGFIVPLSLASVFLVADVAEGPEIIFAGGIIIAPILSSIFSSPRQTALVGAIVVAASLFFIGSAEEAGTIRILLRIGGLLLGVVLAVIYSIVRTRKEKERDELIREILILGQKSELALFDQLTNLNNRRGVLEGLATADVWPRTVALFDVDKLKTINDNFGHQVGDEFISAIAGRLRAVVASTDIIGRWGGDEFIVIFPLSVTQAKAVIERVLGQISSAPFGTGDHRIEPRLSCGFAEWKPVETFEHAISLADTALYRAKSRGGNQAVTDSTLLEA